MKRLIAAILVMAVSCTNADTPPKEVLPEKKMAAILTDIHVAEARVSNMQLKSMDSSLMVFGALQKEIWKKHKVDTAAYKKSYTFYVSHPAYLTRIYEEVTKNLEAREKKKNIKL